MEPYLIWLALLQTEWLLFNKDEHEFINFENNASISDKVQCIINS